PCQIAGTILAPTIRDDNLEETRHSRQGLDHRLNCVPLVEGRYDGGNGASDRFRREMRHVRAPPQELPAPAVQPKQCSPIVIGSPSSAAAASSRTCRYGAAIGSSSIWLKSQS